MTFSTLKTESYAPIGLIAEDRVTAAWFTPRNFFTPCVLRAEHVAGEIIYRRRSLVDCDSLPTVWGFETREEAEKIVAEYLAGYEDMEHTGAKWDYIKGAWTMPPEFDGDIEDGPGDCGDRAQRRAEAGHGE